MLLAAYFATKVAAYVFWCWVALRAFPRGGGLERTFILAAIVGALRAWMGLAFGILIWWLSTLVYGALRDAPATAPLTYVLVYVPVRWVEWSLVALLLAPPARSIRGFFIGGDRFDRAWRLGGIGVSCLADVPIIVSLGGLLPVGRFLC